MTGKNMGVDGEKDDAEELPPLEFEIIPEIPVSSKSKEERFFFEPVMDGGDLEEATLKKLDQDVERLKRELAERDQLHALRTSHTRKLFWLTVVWVCVIWVVLLLQGFEQWFLPYPYPDADQKYLSFKLSDSVLIAFMTSTTATVLGLYGIAAYWLYGKPRKDEGISTKDEKKTG